MKTYLGTFVVVFQTCLPSILMCQNLWLQKGKKPVGGVGTSEKEYYSPQPRKASLKVRIGVDFYGNNCVAWQFEFSSFGVSVTNRKGQVEVSFVLFHVMFLQKTNSWDEDDDKSISISSLDEEEVAPPKPGPGTRWSHCSRQTTPPPHTRPTEFTLARVRTDLKLTSEI